jgi:acetyltransferase-like isoleucine patch superfamily enzyme
LIHRWVHRFRVNRYRAVSSLRTIGSPILHQPLQAVGDGVLEIRGRVAFGFFPSPEFSEGYAYVEARYPGSSVVIDDGTWINNGFVAIAEYSTISIGKRCRIGVNVELIGSDFHGLLPSERGLSKPEWNRPIIVGDDVFIGSHAKILKGVSIGDGAVVAHSAVVTADVPPLAVVGGNPARVVRILEPKS